MEEKIIRITVAETFEEIKKYQGTFESDGLCIFFANNIGSLLEEQGIDYRRLIISSYIDTDYYHEFIVTMPNDKDVAFLIDPSYSQFTATNQKLIKFKR